MTKLLLYCTKAKPYLLCEPYIDENKPCRLLRTDLDKLIYDCVKENAVNGKIVAECDFEVEEIINYHNSVTYYTQSLNQQELLNKSCLGICELDNYLKGQNGYAINIKNLHIFDKPINIKNYYNIAPRTMQDCMNQRVLVKAPQNMCNAYDVYKNHYILISIRPEWLCKILNGEKTIEIRKKVLKEMLKCLKN